MDRRVRRLDGGCISTPVQQLVKWFSRSAARAPDFCRGRQSHIWIIFYIISITSKTRIEIHPVSGSCKFLLDPDMFLPGHKTY